MLLKGTNEKRFASHWKSVGIEIGLLFGGLAGW